jgi:Secretion system C-terminal sorting domain
MKKYIVILGLLYGSVVQAQFNYPPAPPTVANITAAEYFIDTDPGFGTATAIPVTAATDIPLLIAAVNLTGLTPGVHRLFVRSKDANGMWSITATQTFENLQPGYGSVSPLVNITAAEYFIDTDPGFGAATPIPVTAATNIPALVTSINLTGITPGVHQLMVRSKDANGNWSITATATFENLQPLYNSAPAAVNITSAEYFIDTDPGFGLAAPIPLTPAANVNNLLVSIDLTGAGAPGNKLLFIRSMDANGKWSLTNNAQFNNAVYIYPSAPIAPGNVTVMEYFFDTDPGFGNGTPVSFTAAPDLNNFLFSADISALPQGTHTLFIRSRQNPWSVTAASEFLKGITLPVSLLNFSGTLAGRDVLLKWITSAEQNSSHFIVERSWDGIGYTATGRVAAAGNSTVQQQYNYTDAGIAADMVYYRLKQVDRDGQYKYSPVIRIRLTGGPDVVIAPNPVTSQLQMNGVKTGTAIGIVDAAGRQVYSGQWNGTAIPVSHWAKGLYTLQVQTEGVIINRKFMKQ